MKNDMECPYCGAEQEVNHDDGYGYAEGVKHEHTCSECGKVFVFETYISFSYEPFKADCLNGAEHNLRFRIAIPREYSRMTCMDCDYERYATKEEIEDRSALWKQ